MEIKDKHSYMGLSSCVICLAIVIALVIGVVDNGLIFLVILIIITAIALILGLIAAKHRNVIGILGLVANSILITMEIIVLIIGLLLMYGYIAFPA